MLIKDGLTSTAAGVTSDNELKVRAVTINKAEHAAIEKGDAYIWDFSGYDYAAADTAMFIRNDDPDKYLVIDHIHLYCDTASKVQVHCPANPTAAGTAITGYNLNRDSGNTALATAKQDETGNTQGTIFISTYIAANGVINLLDEPGWVLVLGYQDCIGVDIVTVGTMAYGHITGYYYEK